jgi:hypothetical protein
MTAAVAKLASGAVVTRERQSFKKLAFVLRCTCKTVGF